MTAAPDGVVVRRTTEADVGALVDLMEAVAAEGRWIGREAPLDRDEAAGSIRSPAIDASHLSLVAERRGELVGSLGLVDDGWGHAGLGMFVAADARGCGTGTALLVDALTWARTNPAVHKVTLQLWPHNTAASALYRRHGFLVEGYLHRHWRRRNGELWDAVVMGLLVDDHPAERDRTV